MNATPFDVCIGKLTAIAKAGGHYTVQASWNASHTRTASVPVEQSTISADAHEFLLKSQDFRLHTPAPSTTESFRALLCRYGGKYGMYSLRTVSCSQRSFAENL